jgi:hypothetical protein
VRLRSLSGEPGDATLAEVNRSLHP